MTLRLVQANHRGHSFQISKEDVADAQRNLARFACEQAEEASGRLGFGWRASALAPSTYVDLMQEHRVCELSQLPLRVSALHCTPSIFGSASANQAMRFWHDTSHVRLGLSFESDDEMALAAHHMEVLRADGYAAGSLEHRLLLADTAGQVLCAATLGHFPDDQLVFAVTSAHHGIDAAIEEAAIARQCSRGLSLVREHRRQDQVEADGRAYEHGLDHHVGGDAA